MVDDVGTTASSRSRPVKDNDEAYRVYTNWKDWGAAFDFTPVQARYYAIETAGTAIANADVLEIGFGAGTFLAWARSKGARVAGTEIVPEFIEYARANGVEMLDPQIETVAAHHAERFDTIVAFDVFEHFVMSDVVQRLDAAYTMLKPGGHLILRFPNGQSPFGLTPQHGDPTHRSALSLSNLTPALLRQRWTVVRYGSQAIVGGGTIVHKAARFMRMVLRAAIGRFLRFTYAFNHPLDAVVVLVLRKEA